ncbi:type 1 fimbrial protein [Xenorhabdus lircayensis]|uniref:Type 1 fimbrial protein n=1 Tax=Xenorhabdus lircayensis TaxID=2763499 RepID=A0ABS0U3M1_9GAMM|nr:type 1 fimbrial protein [Xenorhabdus lircayensis]MBI6548212.1 type 1 fimbrial protein [Xenorhabdus lircayensis]
MLRKMTTFLFMSLSYPSMANSPSISSSGSIYFQGAIVDSPCQFSWDEKHTEMVCWYNGEQLTQDKTIEYQKESNSLLSLQKHIGTEEIRWVGENKKLGIITITYH